MWVAAAVVLVVLVEVAVVVAAALDPCASAKGFFRRHLAKRSKSTQRT